METHWSRRSLVRLLGISAVAGTLPVQSLAAQGGGIASGGIGMTETEWQAAFGSGEPGQSYMVYVYPTFSATMHVGVEGNSRLVDYFYIPLAETPIDAGLDRGLALSMIESLLPHDARKKQTFIRSETPGSLKMITTEIWTSRSLGHVMGGRRTIMVRYDEVPLGGVGLVTIDVEQL